MINIIWEKVIELLVTAVGQPYVDKWQKNLAVGGSISDLQAALLKAHLLIERSECWRLPKYYPIDKLLPQLKDAVYDAESIVSELEYQRLKNEVEKSLPGISKNFVMNWMNNFPKTVIGALDRLNEKYIEMEKNCDRKGIPENPNQFSQTARPLTSTILETPEVYGREDELEKVISLLGVGHSKRVKMSNLNSDETRSSMDNNGKVSVLPIVGMGGVGKTTLAQMVCNEEIVISHFHLIMWVCVSDTFNKTSITRQMLESATNKECNITNPDTIEKNLLEKLKSKRFLLVLDDVWGQEWQSLLAVMNRSEKGSVVMVTTRSLNCVKNITTGIDTTTIINLDGLEEDIYWDFFRCCAFGSVENANNYPALETIGKEICGRLKGSPLAAKTIGGLLRTIMDERHWRNIKDNKIWQLQQGEQDILPVLQLSYQYLPSSPSPLKKCFSFCSLYPKDYEFTKWELTKLWIMQGFIELQSEFSIYWEDPYIKEAEVCLDELVQRGLFQKAAGSLSDGFVIHDLMHDVCRSITKDECFCIEDADFEYNVSTNIRHLSTFREEMKKEEQMRLCTYKKLLSVRMSPLSSSLINKWCEKLIYIRSLSIPRCKFQSLPTSIGELTHLQYLDISFSDINELPESFCSLYNLLFLNMEGCLKFMFFPKGFNKLVNLCFLYLPAEKLILIGHMENVARKIDYKYMSIEVSAHRKIENLKFMDNLRGELTIKNLELVLSKQTAEEAHLNNKRLISRLTLCWSEHKDPSGGQSIGVERRDEEVLQGLCPHPNLRVLHIDGYGGKILSRIGWLGPNHLLGLQELVIDKCPKLVSIAVESFGQFVSLKKLTIKDCPKLSCPNAMVLPPSIKFLKLETCGNLVTSIPTFLQNLTSLGYLTIREPPRLTSITAEELRNLKSLSWLYIWECAGLQSIGGLEFLVSLRKLDIRRCPCLISIKANVASNLRIHYLNVLDCAELQSLGGLLYLTSLKEIFIQKCPKLQETSGQDMRRGSLIVSDWLG